MKKTGNSERKLTGKEKRILKLRKGRDRLWKDFSRLPRRESFSGLNVASELEKVQQELDLLEGSKRSRRYIANISVEIS